MKKSKILDMFFFDCRKFICLLLTSNNNNQNMEIFTSAKVPVLHTERHIIIVMKYMEKYTIILLAMIPMIRGRPPNTAVVNNTTL